MELEPEPTNPYSAAEQCAFLFKVMLCAAWAIPFITVAAMLALTLIAIPLAIPVAMLGMAPLGKTIKTHSFKVADWNARPTPAQVIIARIKLEVEEEDEEESYEDEQDVPWKL